jgi:hypothetical protein
MEAKEATGEMDMVMGSGSAWWCGCGCWGCTGKALEDVDGESDCGPEGE